MIKLQEITEIKETRYFETKKELNDFIETYGVDSEIIKKDFIHKGIKYRYHFELVMKAKK